MLNEDSETRFDLVPIHKGSSGPLDYMYDLTKSVRLPGAHGEEIVRDLFTDTNVGFSCDQSFQSLLIIAKTQVTYTVGEDGHVRAWKTETPTSAEETMDIDEGADAKKKEKKDRKEKRKEKKEKKDKKRYEPY
jgi:hypothetical protein